MSLPDRLRAVLPPETARAWSELAPLLPPGAYLAGGTGLAAHIHHRASRDLDLFFHQTVDLDALRKRLTATGTFAATRIGDGVLDGVLAGAKVQFLHARSISNASRCPRSTRAFATSCAASATSTTWTTMTSCPSSAARSSATGGGRQPRVVRNASRFG